MRTVAGLLVAASLAITASAHPKPAPQADGAVQLPRSSIEQFQPKPYARYTRSEDVEQPPSAGPDSDYVGVATRFLADKYPNLKFRRFENSYQGTNGVGHVFFKQQINGIDLDNSNININVAPDGSIVSYGASVYEGTLPPQVNIGALNQASAALNTVRQTFGLPASLASAAVNQVRTGVFVAQGAQGLEQDPQIELVYYRSEQNTVVPAWRVETDLGDSWLTSYVKADQASQILAVTDYAAHASYSVYKWPIPNPSGASVSTVSNPENKAFSPLGWHDDGSRKYTTTQGNNGLAQPNRDGGTDIENEGRPNNANLNFIFPVDLTKDPETYANFSATQLFYTANKVHDVFYALGFTEKTGNFQDNNFGKGGVGGDGVILNTQDGSGLNNANFLTPPDGQRGRMRMYIWDRTTPRRDSSLDAGVVIHEYAHGLSNRLTGGSFDGRCLSTTESRGMGEGWSDFYATALRTNTKMTKDTDLPIGEYVSGNAKGIRLYEYSTSLSRNPLTYKSINGMTAVHQIGTVWNSILYEVMWGLIGTKGNTDAEFPTYTNGIPTDGRWLSMKLVTDGLALQPCNPTLATARDAIIDADTALTRGANKCTLWKAFAKRGLGSKTSGTYPNVVESYDVPSGC